MTRTIPSLDSLGFQGFTAQSALAASAHGHCYDVRVRISQLPQEQALAVITCLEPCRMREELHCRRIWDRISSDPVDDALADATTFPPGVSQMWVTPRQAQEQSMTTLRVTDTTIHSVVKAVLDLVETSGSPEHINCPDVDITISPLGLRIYCARHRTAADYPTEIAGGEA